MKKLTTAQQIERKKNISTVMKLILFVSICTALYICIHNYIENNIVFTGSKSNNTIHKNTAKLNTEQGNNTNDLVISSNEENLSSNDVNYPTTNDNDKAISPLNSFGTDTNTTTTDCFETDFINKSEQLKKEAQQQVGKNNNEINKIKEQQEELQSIKNTYQTKKSEIEQWYNSEYNKYSKLLSDAEYNLSNAGGRTTQNEVTLKYKEKASIASELANSGLSNSGYATSRYNQWENEYNALCNRLKYTKQVDEYSYYLNTTLPTMKTEKLLPITEEYKNNLYSFNH